MPVANANAMASIATPALPFVRQAEPLAIARWLFAVAALIVGIVVVGGITRLTESGVSITEWNVVSGILPPLSDAAWQAEFGKYQQTPQFIQVNGPAGMTLATYKVIFFWEWVHRLLARSIGLALALPLALFAIRGSVPKGFGPRLVGLVGLVGLQGAVGWWMVKSGISHDVKVSHLRLATHLLLALTTMACVVWTALDMRRLARGQGAARVTKFGALAIGLLAIQLLLGAMMAGLRAGHVANDWPLMMGSLFPAGIDWSLGTFHALVYDPYLLHFVHRWWAWAVVAVLVVMGRKLKTVNARPASIAIHSAFGLQILLGIATVMSNVSIPLAVLHQLTGALLVIATVWGAHELGRKPTAI